MKEGKLIKYGGVVIFSIVILFYVHPVLTSYAAKVDFFYGKLMKGQNHVNCLLIRKIFNQTPKSYWVNKTMDKIIVVYAFGTNKGLWPKDVEEHIAGNGVNIWYFQINEGNKLLENLKKTERSNIVLVELQVDMETYKDISSMWEYISGEIIEKTVLKDYSLIYKNESYPFIIYKSGVRE